MPDRQAEKYRQDRHGGIDPGKKITLISRGKQSASNIPRIYSPYYDSCARACCPWQLNAYPRSCGAEYSLGRCHTRQCADRSRISISHRAHPSPASRRAEGNMPRPEEYEKTAAPGELCQSFLRPEFGNPRSGLYSPVVRICRTSPIAIAQNHPNRHIRLCRRSAVPLSVLSRHLKK